MRIDNLLLPHPILSPEGSVFGELKFQVIREITSNEVIIKVDVQLKNDVISRLIKEEKASYCLDITCSTTFYRRAFSSNVPNFIINIPAQELRETVDVSCYILAKTPIVDYQNSYLSDIYDGIKFDISEGDVLAYGGHDSFEVLKKWESKESGGAFFMIWEHANKEVRYELGTDPIIIYLHSADYKVLQSIKKNNKLRQVYLTLYAYPALVHVLSTVFSDTNGMYSHMKWYKRIFDILTEKRFEKIEQIPENAPKLAQMIFDFPLSRSLNDLDTIIREIEGS